MFYTIIQYIFIAVVFAVAIWYVIKITKDSFKSNSKSCSKGCGCDDSSIKIKE